VSDTRQMTREEFCAFVRATILENPEWLTHTLSSASHGAQDAIERLQIDRAEWETVAMLTTEARLFKGNGGFIADKIDALRESGGSSFVWDRAVERLRK